MFGRARIAAIAGIAMLALTSAAPEAQAHRHRDNGGRVVAGVLGGLALGAAGATIMGPRTYYAPPPVVYAPPPAYYGAPPYLPPDAYPPPGWGYYAPPPPPPPVYAPRYYGW